MAFLRSHIQQHRKEQFHENAGGGVLPSQRADGFEQPVDEQSDDKAERRSPDERDDEFPGGFSNGEFPGDGGGDCELEPDDARSVVEQGFAFQYAALARGQRSLFA